MTEIFLSKAYLNIHNGIFFGFLVFRLFWFQLKYTITRQEENKRAAPLEVGKFFDVFLSGVYF
jgi:hypothetical protein